MGKGKGISVVRQRAALERLEAAYNKFKAAGEDKKPWDSTRNGRPVHHMGKTYNEECQRMKNEIERLKSHINKNIK